MVSMMARESCPSTSVRSRVPEFSPHECGPAQLSAAMGWQPLSLRTWALLHVKAVSALLDERFPEDLRRLVRGCEPQPPQASLWNHDGGVPILRGARAASLILAVLGRAGSRAVGLRPRGHPPGSERRAR